MNQNEIEKHLNPSNDELIEKLNMAEKKIKELTDQDARFKEVNKMKSRTIEELNCKNIDIILSKKLEQLKKHKAGLKQGIKKLNKSLNRNKGLLAEVNNNIKLLEEIRKTPH